MASEGSHNDYFQKLDIILEKLNEKCKTNQYGISTSNNPYAVSIPASNIYDNQQFFAKIHTCNHQETSGKTIPKFRFIREAEFELYEKLRNTCRANTVMIVCPECDELCAIIGTCNGHISGQSNRHCNNICLYIIPQFKLNQMQLSKPKCRQCRTTYKENSQHIASFENNTEESSYPISTTTQSTSSDPTTSTTSTDSSDPTTSTTPTTPTTSVPKKKKKLLYIKGDNGTIKMMPPKTEN